MLRVSSVLYLQQVWTRPSYQSFSPSISSSILQIQSEQVITEPFAIIRKQGCSTIEENEPDHSIMTITVNEQASSVPKEDSLILEQSEKDTDTQSISSKDQDTLLLNQPDKEIIKAESVHEDVEVSLTNDLFLEADQEEGDQHDLPQHSDASASDSTSSIHTGHSFPSSSESPMTNHETLSKIEFESDESPKLSPKKILTRARTNVTEDTVRSFGRRTSLFLEKIYLPESVNTLKNLRNKSTKLTNKGKSFSKKLKRAVSFHHSQHPQPTF